MATDDKMSGVYPEPMLLHPQHPHSRVRDNSCMACSEASVPEMKGEARGRFLGKDFHPERKEM